VGAGMKIKLHSSHQ